MSAAPTVELLAALCVLIVTLGLLLYILARLRARRREIVEELSRPRRSLDSRALTGAGRPSTGDLAYNQMQLVRAELKVAQRDGLDGRPARSLLEEAERRYGQREYDRALELARTAHESLVRLRMASAGPSAPPANPLPTSPAEAAGAEQGPTEGTPEARPQVPRNQAEARFQLRLLASELAARPMASSDSTPAEAAELSREAQAAYDGGQYTEAMRLALRARRRLGASIESLPAAATSGPAGTAEAGSGLSCPACGRPATAADRFCRGCGRAIGSPTCGACGAPRGPEDGFCGRCGQPFAAGAD